MKLRHFFIILLIANVAFADKPTVGFSLPLTGMVANMGEGFRRGIELYEKDKPELPFQVVLDDHRYDGKQAVSSYQSLRTVKKADTIVVWGNSPAEVMAPLADRDNQNLITTSAVPVAKGRKTVLNFGYKADDFSDTIVKYVKDGGYKNYGILSINLGNALDIISMIKKQVPVKDFLVEATTNDFVPQILKLKKEKVDGLLLFLLPEGALTYAKQAKGQQFSVPTLGGDVFADEAFQKNIAATLPNLSIIYGGAADAFKGRLTKSFNDGSFYFESATAYSIMKLLDGYYSASTRGTFKEFAAGLDLKNYGLPVEGLTYSDTADYGALLGCTFKITKTLQ